MTEHQHASTATIEEPTDQELETGRPMRADAKRNVESLVAAAAKVFAEQGGSVSLEAVAKEAGVGIGTLYRHFPKRIDLVEAVYRDDVDQLVANAQVFVNELDPWSALAAWLEAFVAYSTRKRNFLTELHEAFEKNPELKIGARGRIEGAASVVLVGAQAAGVARTDLNGADLMQLLGSMCMSATLTPDQSQRLLVMIKDGLRPPAG